MKELTENELKSCNGGLSVFGVKIPMPLPVEIALLIAYEVYDNWDDIKAGWNSYQPKYIGK